MKSREGDPLGVAVTTFVLTAPRKHVAVPEDLVQAAVKSAQEAKQRAELDSDSDDEQ